MRAHPWPTTRIIASALLGIIVAVGATSARSDTEDGARRHAAKANRLKGKNKCKAALPEYTRAYKTLKDPTLLFNRAECLRALGRDAEALKDYEQFLVDLPDAPNRSTVQARIAVLRGEVSPAKPAPASVEKEGPVAASQEAPATPPAAKPVEKPAVPPPAAHRAPPAPKSAESAPAAAPPSPAAAPAAPPPAPARRAEKWTD
jgi:tetratricopeptide (TPR) repeat protein